MFHIEPLTNIIIAPTLKALNMYSKSAVNLMLGTAAVESDMGCFVEQINGPALGIYQMEPNTFHDNIKNNLIFRRKLCGIVLKELVLKDTSQLKSEMLKWNLKLSTIMCRIHYSRSPITLPHESDIEGLACYWKKYYNTVKGKGTVEKFIEKYNKYVIGDKE